MPHCEIMPNILVFSLGLLSIPLQQSILMFIMMQLPSSSSYDKSSYLFKSNFLSFSTLAFFLVVVLAWWVVPSHPALPFVNPRQSREANQVRIHALCSIPQIYAHIKHDNIVEHWSNCSHPLATSLIWRLSSSRIAALRSAAFIGNLEQRSTPETSDLS